MAPCISTKGKKIKQTSEVGSKIFITFSIKENTVTYGGHECPPSKFAVPPETQKQ